jgi:hypothetical protein
MSGFGALTTTYAFALRNDSTTDVAMSDAGVTDSVCSPVAQIDGGPVLDVGETSHFACTATHSALGTLTGTATAVATSDVDARPVTSGPARSSVTVSAAPTPTPTAGGTETLAETATPAPTEPSAVVPPATHPAPASQRIVIPFSSSLRPPAGVSRAKACRGRITAQLKVGKRVLATATTRLDRRCRYRLRFSVPRSRLNAARPATIAVRFAGNRYLRARSVTHRRAAAALPASQRTGR